MSRPITEDYWRLWCGDMPMPEGADWEMMMAAYEAISEMERRDDAVKDIAFFSEMLERDEKRLKEAEEWGDIEQAETFRSIIKTTKEIINTCRSRLQ